MPGDYGSGSRSPDFVKKFKRFKEGMRIHSARIKSMKTKANEIEVEETLDKLEDCVSKFSEALNKFTELIQSMTGVAPE